MTSEDHLRSSMLRYLTGSLTEQERALFEDRLLTEQEFSDAAAVCEQDLIDAYALGTLHVEEASGIRPWIEASPSRMQRAGMARALLTKRRQGARGKRHISMILAAAACLLAVVGVTLNLIHKPTRKNAMTVSPGTSEPPVNAVAAPSGATPQPGNAGKPEILLLVAERLRGPQQITTYSIRRDAPVRLQVLLIGETARSGYSLRLTSQNGEKKIFLEREDLSAQPMDRQLYIEAAFPPGSLPPGTYSAIVSRGGDTLTSHFSVK